MKDFRGPLGFSPPRELLERVEAAFPKHADLARRLRVSPSHVSRLLRGVCGLGSEACIRLVDLISEDRASVLEAFGHAEMSARFRSGAATTSAAAPVPHPFDHLGSRDRQLLQALLDRMTESGQSVHKRGPQRDAGKGGPS